MKTLADFKRTMKPGTWWRGVNLQYNSTLSIRKCVKASTVSFGFENEKTGVSYADFPKASDIEFPNETTVVIYGYRSTVWCEKTHQWLKERVPVLSYELVPAPVEVAL